MAHAVEALSLRLVAVSQQPEGSASARQEHAVAITLAGAWLGRVLAPGC